MCFSLGFGWSARKADRGRKVKSGKGQSSRTSPVPGIRCTFGSFRAVSGCSLPRVTCLPRLLIEGAERSVLRPEVCGFWKTWVGNFSRVPTGYGFGCEMGYGYSRAGRDGRAYPRVRKLSRPRLREDVPRRDAALSYFSSQDRNFSAPSSSRSPFPSPPWQLPDFRRVSRASFLLFFRFSNNAGLTTPG